jgi:N-acetylglucosaminyldiphosphoundecaprenol N-acetyl-beta-D-mannosaminyltransferase
MANKSIDILGVRIDILKISQINEIIVDRANRVSGDPLVVFKPYVEFLALSARNDDIRALLGKSDYNVADSSALQWAASYLYGSPKKISAIKSLLFKIHSIAWRSQVIPQRMGGVDQTIPLLKLASDNNFKIGILGGPKDVDRTQQQLLKRFKGIDLKVWSGYYSASSEAQLVKQISDSKLDILFCAMGFPKQEYFIVNNRAKLGAKVLIGEGGSFDYDSLGGPLKRAPALLRRLSLEWLWRLLLQPRRAVRQLSIPIFIAKVIKQKSIQK